MSSTFLGLGSDIQVRRLQAFASKLFLQSKLICTSEEKESVIEKSLNVSTRLAHDYFLGISELGYGEGLDVVPRKKNSPIYSDSAFQNAREINALIDELSGNVSCD